MDKARAILVFLLCDSETAIRHLAGVMRAAKERGWRTQIAPSYLQGGDGSHLAISLPGGGVEELLDSWRPDGCVVIGSSSMGKVPRELAGRLPTVFPGYEREIDQPMVGGIYTDETVFARIAVRELLRSGYRDYAYVPWVADVRWSRERGDAFARLVRDAGMRFHEFTKEAGTGGDSGIFPHGELASWLVELPKPVGVFAANDAVAREVLKACAGLGLAVPGAVAVMGVDDRKWFCDNVAPTLTSIAPDNEGMGVAAVELLDDMMKSPESVFPLRACGGAELVRRESTRFENMRDWRVSRMLDAIRAHACDEGYSPREVVRAIGISRAQADHLFRTATGHTILAEIHSVRLARAKVLLAKGRRTDFVAFECGYSSDDDFRRVFRRQFGMTPRQWALRHN